MKSAAIATTTTTAADITTAVIATAVIATAVFTASHLRHELVVSCFQLCH